MYLQLPKLSQAFDIPEFIDRFYLWSLADFHREKDFDYPYLRLINNNRVRNYVLPHLQAADDVYLESLADAMVKVYQSQAAARLGQPLTPSEKNTLNKFHLRTSAAMDLEEEVGNSIIGFIKRRRQRQQLADALRAALGPLFGAPISSEGSFFWRYVFDLKQWAIVTDVNVDDKQQYLTYHHMIVPASQTELDSVVNLAYRTSILKWMGISMDTKWDLNDGDFEDVAQSLAKVCDHFVQSMPLILDDIFPA